MCAIYNNQGILILNMFLPKNSITPNFIKYIYFVNSNTCEVRFKRCKGIENNINSLCFGSYSQAPGFLPYGQPLS